MKVCRKNRKRIVWFILDELDATQAAELRLHLESCPGCREYHQQMLAVTHRLKALDSLSIGDTASAVASLTRDSVQSVRFAHPRIQRPICLVPAWRLILPALAIVTMALLVLATLERQTPSTQQPQVAVLAPRDSAPTEDLLPTLSNYRAIANHSLDELDDVLSKQGRKPVASPPLQNQTTLALLNIPD